MRKKEDRKKERQKVYNSSRWKSIREYMKQTYPLCQDCLKNGKVTPMEEVHHIESPFKRGLSQEEKEKRAYSLDNLVCLCKQCHINRHHPEGTIIDKLRKYK